uniref:Uncharacterized protein n=1 Tax=Octopus bimaculoides TaxID=37653 RepID=A0A0L8I452_OCTBM
MYILYILEQCYMFVVIDCPNVHFIYTRTKECYIFVIADYPCGTLMLSCS